MNYNLCCAICHVSGIMPCNVNITDKLVDKKLEYQLPNPNGDFVLLPPSPYISFHFLNSFMLTASYATDGPTYTFHKPTCLAFLTNIQPQH